MGTETDSRKSAALPARVEKLARLGSWEWNRQEDEYTLSEGCQRIIGTKRSELSGTELRTIVHPDDFVTVSRAFDALRATAKPFDVEHRIVRQDNGAVRIVQVYGEFDCDESGKPVRMYGALQDITERKMTEAALRESETNLREAQQIARLGRWELDLTTQSLHWSDTIFDIFELDRAVFGASYEAFLDAIHPDDRDSVNRAYTQSLVDRQPYSIEHRLLTKNGHIKWLNEICRTDYDAQGQALRSVGIVQDISEQKRAEEALRASEAHFRHLNEHLSAGVVVHAPDTSVLLANREASRVLGLAQEEMRGKVVTDPVWTFVREDGSRLPRNEYPVQQVLARQQPVTGLIVGIDRASPASRFWALVNAFPDYDGHGELLQIVVTFVDITERIATEEALRDSEERFRRLSEENENLLHEVNHRVGNNLALLMALLDWTIDDTALLETRQALHNMRGRVDSMAEVHRLLNRTKWSPIDIRHLIPPIINSLLAGVPGRQRIDYRLDCPPEPVVVAAKPAFKIALIVNELVTNSLKYAFADREAGRITVAIATEEPWIELTYTDDGPGWPADVLAGGRQNMGLSLLHAIIEREMEGAVTLCNHGGARTELRFIPKAEGELHSL